MDPSNIKNNLVDKRSLLRHLEYLKMIFLLKKVKIIKLCKTWFSNIFCYGWYRVETKNLL